MLYSAIKTRGRDDETAYSRRLIWLIWLIWLIGLIWLIAATVW
jgi:hypothetical protein